MSLLPREGPLPLRIGQRYKVTLSDCCVHAVFTATLLSVEWDSGTPEDQKNLWNLRRLTFDNGVVVSSFLGVRAEEETTIAAP